MGFRIDIWAYRALEVGGAPKNHTGMASILYNLYVLIKLDSIEARNKPVSSQYHWLLHVSQQTYWLEAGLTLDSWATLAFVFKTVTLPQCSGRIGSR